jgi:DNA topoisomerase-2
VRDATATQISENTEIQHLKQILGLQHGKQYEDAKALRYGSLMIMTDQDHDGSHIKGLIMNFLHTFYPSLLKVPGFLVEFITPIIKVCARALRPGWQESMPVFRGHFLCV